MSYRLTFFLLILLFLFYSAKIQQFPQTAKLFTENFQLNNVNGKPSPNIDITWLKHAFMPVSKLYLIYQLFSYRQIIRLKNHKNNWKIIGDLFAHSESFIILNSIRSYCKAQDDVSSAHSPFRRKHKKKTAPTHRVSAANYEHRFKTNLFYFLNVLFQEMPQHLALIRIVVADV